MKKIWNRIVLFFVKIFGGTYIAEKCGHKTKLRGSFVAFRERFSGRITPKNGKVNYCHECVGKMTIRCAWCESPIIIGDPITLYTPTDKSFSIPEYAVIHQKEPLQLVGCLRWGCGDSGADRAGFWVEPGKVLRVLSPIEQITLAAEKGEEVVVIVNDLYNINEAIQAPQ